MKKMLYAAAFLASGMVFWQCADLKPAEDLEMASPTLPEQPYDYEATAFVQLVDSEEGTPFGGISLNKVTNFAGSGLEAVQTVTNAGATLGRVLFYDPRLSVNNTISCGSCHNAAKGYGDSSAKTVGFSGKNTQRNSMAIANIGLQNGSFWTNNVEPLSKQVMNPVRNHLEMGMEDVSILVDKLSKTDFYAPLFKAAFGSAAVSEDRIGNAIAQFLLSMSSRNSKTDKVMDGGSSYTTLEQQGRDIFHSQRALCSSCHNVDNHEIVPITVYYGEALVPPVAPNLSRGSNIGLTIMDEDLGNGIGGFKIPFLRNVAVTAPYMHDGSIATLSDVIDHYSHGIADNPNLDPRLRQADGSPKKMNFTAQEKEALIAFLNTLTDETYLNDVRFSDPFKQ